MAIGSGQPVLSLLADFLRTTPAVVRASRNWPLEAVLGISCWRTACRYVHCLGMLGPLPESLTGQLFLLQRWLPVIDLVGRRFGVSRRALLDEAERELKGLDRQFFVPRTRTFAYYRGLLRAIRAVTATDEERRCGQILAYVRSRMPGGESSLGLRLTLPCGWSVTELLTWSEIELEVDQSRHCAASLKRGAAEGAIQLLSLRCANAIERVTISVGPPIVGDASDGTARVKMLGPNNDSISHRALQALAELLQTVGSPNLRISFG